MGMAAAISADPACSGTEEVDHGSGGGGRVAGRCGRREAWGRAAAWHAEADEEKGKRGGRLSTRGRRKEGGLVARRRVEEESVGGGAGGQQGTRPVEAVAGRASSA
jgi:hypothetical protein